MEYTCFEGMGALPFLMEERGGTMNNMHSASTYSSASNQLLESFQAQQHQQQQLNPNYYYNPPVHFNFPAVSWSTTDPTLLLSDPQPQRQEELFSVGTGGNSVNVSSDGKGDDDMGIEGSCCGLSSFPTTVQELHHSRSNNNLCHHNAAGVSSSTAETAERMNLNLDTTMLDAGGVSIRRGTGFPSGSSARSTDPFSFCGGGGGGGRGIAGGGNVSSQSHWIPQMCSLTSDQYYGCGDALMLPKLVSDPFSESQQQQLQQQPLGTYYTSSTSVNCLHEADSCGSSDRDQATTSEEINWMNNSTSRNNNSDISTLPNLHRGCGDSVTGLMLSSPSVVPVEIVPDEYSSSIVAAVNDDVELAAVTTASRDHVRHHHHNHRSTCGSSTIECGAAAAPSGRVSWMSPGIGSCQNPHLQLQQMSNGLVPMLPRSLLGPFKPNQQRSQTSDSIHNVQSSVQRALPFSSSTSQANFANCSGGIYPRYSSVHPVMPPLMNPGVVNNCTTSGDGSFCKDFHSFSNRLPQQQGAMATTASSVQPGGILGVKEFNLGGGFESRRDFGSEQGVVLSTTRKPNATSIEPQSVAARYRRKKISERVKILEKLIPGVDKMDTASMLDEAIEYVKFLQLQVQLLESMGDPEAANAPSTTTTTSTENNDSSALYNSTSNPCNVDSGALTGGGFGSSSHLSRSASFMQQVTIAAAANATTKSSSSPPLILSEVLQEQLFKQKLCLVSLRQFPQQQAR